MPSRKEEKPPSPEALALLYLRSKRNWTQKKLSTRLGLTEETRQISHYETGARPLYRDRLEALAAVLGYPPEAVDGLLLVDRWIDPVAPEEPFSPVALTPEEHRSRDRTVLTAAGAFLDELRRELSRKKRERKAAAVRRQAQELWLRLKAAPRQDRRDLVAAMPRFQDWALAEHVCEASIRAAAHKPDEALHLADLAVFIARKAPGAESWRSRLEGYCWAHVANARRVASDFSSADKAFAQAWKLWRAGAASDPTLLSEWRLLDLEASLRRDERRFQEALELLDRAIATNKVKEIATGQILLNKEFIFDQIGDLQGALTALIQAAPLVEASGNKRLLFALQFKIANRLCQLGRCDEASKKLPHVRELAEQLGNELDLIRVLWLEARLIAKQGQTVEAIAILEQVRRDFTVRGVPYDAALASLELAVLYLHEGRSPEVQQLACTLTWVFQAHGIAREALASLALFSDAANRKAVTVELVQRVIADLEKRESRPLLRMSNGKAEDKNS